MGGWQAYCSKKIIPVLTFSVIFTFFMIFSEIPTAVAQTQEYEFNVIEGDDITTDPNARHILDQIELSKKILEDMQSDFEKDIFIPLNEQQKIIEELRKTSQARLDAELERMNKKYEDHSPRNAFASFVSDKPAYMQAFYWDQFNYLDDKVSYAKYQRDQVLDNGGTVLQAQQVFIEYATFPKSEVESVFYGLVEKHDLYDHYSGELDPYKWYPEAAVEAFESWKEHAKDRYSVDSDSQSQNLGIQIKNDQTIENISLESAIVFETESEEIVYDFSSTEIVCSESLELVFRTFNGSAMCVKPSAADKMIERGFAIEA